MTVNTDEQKYKFDASRLPQPILDAHPDWVALYNFTWELGANNTRMSRGRWHLDTSWGTGDEDGWNYQWVWDTALMILWARYSGGALPIMESFDNFYELQRDDGYISMTYDFDTDQEPYPGRINPPLFAWVEWEYYLTTGNDSRFERVVPHIERLMDWIEKNRTNYAKGTDNPDIKEESVEALYWFADCGSSGMDDSPRTPRNPDAGKFYHWIDLSSQMVLSFYHLAKMHRVLGNIEAADKWEEKAKIKADRINECMWSDKTEFYHDLALPGRFVSTKTVASFWPILAGICKDKRLKSLINHLCDEREFNRPIPVPGLSADDPNYREGGNYYCGGVWAPTNYMITRGLQLAGEGGLAHEIAMKYLGGVARTWRNFEPHTLWEGYAPEFDAPARRPYDDGLCKPDFVGWSGIGPITMLIENIIGLDISVPEKTITWDIRLTERHGIRNLSIGKWKIDLLSATRNDVDTPAEVTVCSDVKLTIILHRGSVKKRMVTTPGIVEKITV